MRFKCITNLCADFFQLFYIFSCVSDSSQHSDVCYQDDTKCRQPNIVQTGHLQYGVCYQGNNVLHRLEGTNLLNCVKECMMTSNCTSINYRTNWSCCDVVGALALGQQLYKEPGCIHSMISTWPKTIGGECTDNVCEMGERCQVYQGVLQCKIAYCKDLPAIRNATCVERFGLYRNIGRGSKFKCNEGFSMLGRPFSVCKTDGHWQNMFACVENPFYPRDCNDIPSGPPLSGVYTIYPSLPELSKHFDVYCDMDTDGGKWTVFQRRTDGSTDFYRDWSAYEDGFGDRKEFWLGNSKLSAILGNDNFELRIDLEDFEGRTEHVTYSTFNIGDASTKYKLTIGGYSGTLGDNMRYHNGMPFSTKDNDNDEWNRNCAKTFHGAWWYSKCHAVNLNGLYYYPGETPAFGKGVIWLSWKNSHFYSLKKTKMMFRRHRTQTSV